MVHIPDIVNDYQQRYGMSFWDLETSLTPGIIAAVVVPAIAEYNNIKTFLKSFSELNSRNFDSPSR